MELVKMNGSLCQMFGGLYIKRLPLAYFYQVCSIRTDSRKSLRRYRPSKPSNNPGIENRLRILKMESQDFNVLEQEDIHFDDLESDFMKAGEMHKEYQREKKRAADSLAYQITKRKHFKPTKLPNLLMWTEKEQIRNLHQLDAIEWSPEKLAQQFPATTEIIKKLIKSQWKPRNDAETERHDRSVQGNWSDLLQGKFDLDPDFKQHLLSFSSRERGLPKVPASKRKEVIIHNKLQGSKEFSDIVKNFSKVKSSSEHKHLEVNITDHAPAYLNKRSSDPKGDSFVIPSRFHFKRELLPLKEYKEKVLSLVDEESEGDELTREYYNHLKKGNVEKENGELNSEGLQLDEKLPNKTKMLQKYKPVEEDNNLLPQHLDVYMKAENYKMTIKIPEEKFDRSAIYKVKDCFYDADGKFLYRVPGLNH